jgi:hypothetical protein
MSRKKRELIESPLEINAGNNKEQTAVAPPAASSSVRWMKLGKFERIGIVALGLFLVAGVFGATGLGGKILNTFAGQPADGGNQTALNNSSASTLNPAPVAATTGEMPQLSKEYIYAGARLLAVEDKNANAAPPVDFAVWRPSNGVWYVAAGDGSLLAGVQFGANGDVPLPGDYDGDGKTDFCVFRVSGGSGIWYIMPSSTGVYYSVGFGVLNDIPVPAADYDGDGKTDLAVYRQSDTKWHILRSSDQQAMAVQWGVNNNADQPAPADYDGDGKADIAVWRKADQKFYALLSTLNYNSTNHQVITFSSASTTDSKPVSADFDGDGKADYAIYNPGATGVWYVRHSSTGQVVSQQWGTTGDVTVENDYDGDGKVDHAVWRGATGGYWYVLRSTTGYQSAQWGASGDIPVPIYYRR